jgi:hypothetical protein
MAQRLLLGEHAASPRPSRTIGPFEADPCGDSIRSSPGSLVARLSPPDSASGAGSAPSSISADQCACLDVGARPRARRRAHDCVGANARPLLAARDGLASLAAAVAPARESRFKALRRGPLLGARAASPASPCSSRPRDEPYVAAVAWAGLRSGSRSRAHVASGPRVPRASTAWGH